MWRCLRVPLWVKFLHKSPLSDSRPLATNIFVHVDPALNRSNARNATVVRKEMMSPVNRLARLLERSDNRVNFNVLKLVI